MVMLDLVCFVYCDTYIYILYLSNRFKLNALSADILENKARDTEVRMR